MPDVKALAFAERYHRFAATQPYHPVRGQDLDRIGESLRDAATNNRQRAYALILWGEALLEEGRYQKAWEVFWEARYYSGTEHQVVRGFATAHIASTLTHQGKTEEAMRYANSAMRDLKPCEKSHPSEYGFAVCINREARWRLNHPNPWPIVRLWHFVFRERYGTLVLEVI